tara:strand:+ start:348 stop:683 length:336 start_codon:yes stop_codon:yes gene_type:complete
MILRLKNSSDIKFFEAMVKRLGLYGQGMGKDKLSDVGTDYSTENLSEYEQELLLAICSRLSIKIETSEHCDGCYEGMFEAYWVQENGERFCSSNCLEKNGNKSNCFLKTMG